MAVPFLVLKSSPVAVVHFVGLEATLGSQAHREGARPLPERGCSRPVLSGGEKLRSGTCRVPSRWARGASIASTQDKLNAASGLVFKTEHGTAMAARPLVACPRAAMHVPVCRIGLGARATGMYRCPPVVCCMMGYYCLADVLLLRGMLYSCCVWIYVIRTEQPLAMHAARNDSNPQQQIRYEENCFDFRTIKVAENSIGPKSEA